MSSNDDIVLSVRNVSKCFEMYEKPVHRLYQTLCAGKKKFYKEFWALKDISFDVRRGECVGIIGRNGAGKSTLLQVITGTLAPTNGEVQVKGRIAALLELGSGFNPEFTGRENVYLNGVILGLSRKEIDERYDDILAFADIGEFIDQPVKTYSSGMMVRLAFAVQVMVDPDILIVDEALAVGDARFQLKCFKRLEILREKGTSILFVSHAIDQVRSMCDHALLLEHGNQFFWGDSKEAVLRYMQLMFPEQKDEHLQSETSKIRHGDDLHVDEQRVAASDKGIVFVPDAGVGKFGVGGAWLDKVTILGLGADKTFCGGEKFRVIFNYSWDVEQVKKVMSENSLSPDLTCGISLADKQGSYLFGCNGFDAKIPVDFSTGNHATAVYEFRMPVLKAGSYFMTFAIALGRQSNHVQFAWYDYAVELVSAPAPDVNIYGAMAIPYEMSVNIEV